MDDQSLAKRVQKLEDAAAIKDVQYEYWRAMDLKDPDALLDVFSPDGIHIEFPDPPVWTDRDEFLAMFREHGMNPQWQGNHYGLAPKIVVNDDGTATGHWRVQMIAYDFGNRVSIRMTSEYFCGYSRLGNEWRIKSMKVKQHSVFTESVAEDGQLSAVGFGPVGAAAAS